MRRYLYAVGNPAALPGWKLYVNRGDGHPFELMPAAMREGDAFPEHTVLCDRVGAHWQLVCLSNSEEQRAKLEASLAIAAAKAGLVLYDSAKAFSSAQPATADAVLYEQASDKDGKPLGKAPGAVLRCSVVLAGDDAAVAADPKPAALEPLKEIE